MFSVKLDCLDKFFKCVCLVLSLQHVYSQNYRLQRTLRAKLVRRAYCSGFSLQSNSLFSVTTGCISSMKVLLDSFIFSKVGSKIFPLVFVVCFWALMNWFCQQMRKILVEMIIVEKLWKLDSKYFRCFFKKFKNIIHKTARLGNKNTGAIWPSCFIFLWVRYRIQMSWFTCEGIKAVSTRICAKKPVFTAGIFRSE